MFYIVSYGHVQYKYSMFYIVSYGHVQYKYSMFYIVSYGHVQYKYSMFYIVSYGHVQYKYSMFYIRRTLRTQVYNINTICPIQYLMDMYSINTISSIYGKCIKRYTRSQRENSLWYEQRCGRLTASCFHDIVSRKSTSSPDNLVMRLVVPYGHRYII